MAAGRNVCCSAVRFAAVQPLSVVVRFVGSDKNPTKTKKTKQEVKDQ